MNENIKAIEDKNKSQTEKKINNINRNVYNIY